jgi:hydroxymethylpyrimidine/phosphomethylpyrimidine kinase
MLISWHPRAGRFPFEKFLSDKRNRQGLALSTSCFARYTPSVKKVLTIAGFDPSGGAGIQTDLKIFRAFREYGLSVVAALTAQNSKGVSAVMAVDAAFVRKQLMAVLSDFIPDATKIGMLYSRANVRAVSSVIRKYALRNVVLDPVVRSSSGKRLAEEDTLEVMRKKLLPLCTVVTPNINEASLLTGITVRDRRGMEKAAMRLREYGCGVVIITGGHLEKIAMDLFYDGEFHYLSSRKISGEFHGTGCAFSSAVAASLAMGNTALDAAKTAKRFMNSSLKRSFGKGTGMRLLDI